MLPNGDVVVAHRELLGTINTPGTLTFRNTLTVPINAGNGALSPWLAALSQQYESYLFRSLKFDYVPYIPTTYAGQIFFTVDYDAGDAPPLSAAEFSVTPGSMNCAATQRASMVCRPRDLCKRAPSYYVRTPGSGAASTASSQASIRAFDTGNFYVGLEPIINALGDQYVGKVGAIWVSYEVVLTTPQPTVPPVGAFVSSPVNTIAAAAGTNYAQKLSATASNAMLNYDSSLLTSFPSLASAYPLFTASVPTLMAIARTTLRTTSPGVTPNMLNLLHKAIVASQYLYPVATSIKTKTFGLVAQPELELVSAFVFSGIQGSTFDLEVDFYNIDAVSLQYSTKFDIYPVTSLKNAFAGFFNGESSILQSPVHSVLCRSGAALTAANPFGTAVGRSLPAIDWIPYDEATGVFTFPQGTYNIYLEVTGTVITASPVTLAGAGSVSYATSTVINAAATDCWAFRRFSAPAAGCTIDVSVTATTVTGARMHIVSDLGNAEQSTVTILPL
jgi:hypothetical protein